MINPKLKNTKLQHLIEEIQTLCNPKDVHICDGSDSENQLMWEILEQSGSSIKLNREGSWYVRSDPDDVARVEASTYICSEKEEDAGPTNNWFAPHLMKEKLIELFTKAMQGRTMYVIPYSMGPVGSKLTRYGIEITDSPYVVVNMRIMTRMGGEVLEAIENGADFIPGIHSVGQPLTSSERDSPWPCNKTKYIVHFPETREIWSFGSGYGGNALLGKKCFALRIASTMARDEDWMAEHMLILGLENPEGEKKYFAAAFPSACGKTNLAMTLPSIPGWKITCVGDDIAWMQFGADGKLYAINPENGYFGVAPGTSDLTNPNAIKTIEKNAIFTNVALTEDKDVWWEGMTEKAPENLTDWKGRLWKFGTMGPASHPNARFTVSMRQCPVFDPKADDVQGVPIEGIIFGGRRSTLAPLVVESFNWAHGVLQGASQSSEMTAAAKGNIGALRHDPFAMLPFCGYHMGDYFQHWLNQEKDNRKMPKIFTVNWFRKDAKGQFLWPGFGENARVLKWMFERIDNKVEATQTPIGLLPKKLDLTGLNLQKNVLDQLFKVDREGYLKDIEELEKYFTLYKDKFPEKLKTQLAQLKSRL